MFARWLKGADWAPAYSLTDLHEVVTVLSLRVSIFINYMRCNFFIYQAHVIILVCTLDLKLLICLIHHTRVFYNSHGWVCFQGYVQLFVYWIFLLSCLESNDLVIFSFLLDWLFFVETLVVSLWIEGRIRVSFDVWLAILRSLICCLFLIFLLLALFFFFCYLFVSFDLSVSIAVSFAFTLAFGFSPCISFSTNFTLSVSIIFYFTVTYSVSSNASFRGSISNISTIDVVDITSHRRSSFPHCGCSSYTGSQALDLLIILRSFGQ